MFDWSLLNGIGRSNLENKKGGQLFKKFLMHFDNSVKIIVFLFKSLLHLHWWLTLWELFDPNNAHLTEAFCQWFSWILQFNSVTCGFFQWCSWSESHKMQHSSCSLKIKSLFSVGSKSAQFGNSLQNSDEFFCGPLTMEHFSILVIRQCNVCSDHFCSSLSYKAKILKAKCFSFAIPARMRSTLAKRVGSELGTTDSVEDLKI